jgi:hypothetical protein
MTPRLHSLACGGLFLLTIGCYQSSKPLGPPERGVLDPSVVGTWRCEDSAEGSTQVAHLLVVPFDRSQYYLEWREDDKTGRYRAYSTQLHGQTLFNVRELETESPTARWTFLRATREGGGALSLSVVNKDSLKESRQPAALKEIARRIKDEALYEPSAICSVEK